MKKKHDEKRSNNAVPIGIFVFFVAGIFIFISRTSSTREFDAFDGALLIFAALAILSGVAYAMIILFNAISGVWVRWQEPNTDQSRVERLSDESSYTLSYDGDSKPKRKKKQQDS